MNYIIIGGICLVTGGIIGFIIGATANVMATLKEATPPAPPKEEWTILKRQMLTYTQFGRRFEGLVTLEQNQKGKLRAWMVGLEGHRENLNAVYIAHKWGVPVPPGN